MKFSKWTTFLGRNGMFRATGLRLSNCVTAESSSVVVIEPITSLERPGRCNIEVPVEDVPALIKELQTLVPTSPPTTLRQVAIDSSVNSPLKLKLEMEITYENGRGVVGELFSNLHEVVTQAVDNGTLTGPTDATVHHYTVKVIR
jgi:hypothetical protein